LETLITWVLILATLTSGLLAGISLDKSLVQLPARHQMGVVAFAAFSRAADLGRGLIWYPLLGIGAPVLILIALLLQGVQGFRGASTLPLILAAVLGLAHVIATSPAAPVLLLLRQGIPDAATLQALYQRFTAWHTVRCILQVATFAVTL
jgi:hypothetical protein